MRTNSVLYFASHHSLTHVGSALSLSRLLPDVDLHLVTAEKLDHLNNRPDNLHISNLEEANCSIKIDERIFMRTFPYVTDPPNVNSFRKHLYGFINELERINPNLVVIDMTSEFAIIAKLLGYPTAYFYETVDNHELRFRIVFNSVDSVIVRYPKRLLEILGEKIYPSMFFAGGVSRFDDKKRNAKADDAAVQRSSRITFISGSKTHDSEREANYYTTVIAAAREIPRAQLTVIYPTADEYSRKAQQLFPGVEFVIGQSDIFDILQQSDLVICGGGMGVVMESALANVPILSIPVPWVFEEQYKKAVALEKLGAVRMLDYRTITDRKIKKNIALLLNPRKRQKMLLAQRALIDGLGYVRIAEHIKELLASEKCQNKISA